LQRQGQPLTLVDDSYNANPDSVLAAIEVLASLPGPRWLLLGDMGEVGQQGAQFHAEVGARARQRGIEAVWAAGALCAHAGATRWFENTAALTAALGGSAVLPPSRSVLVKGSRFMKMEQVVQALQQRWGQHAA
jgi:UDP-N-acetylmuramoyl-tripeptide--D-alanyl-D-alanine ligase